jgi:hypothetical protein
MTDALIRSATRLSILAAGAAFFVSGCHLAASPKEQQAEARAVIIKAANDSEEWTGKPVIQTIRRGKAEEDALLGTFCGTITDDGAGQTAQKPRHFIYMAVEKLTVFETLPSDPAATPSDEERKLTEEVANEFNDLWNNGCN